MVQLNSFAGGITGTCKHCCIFFERNISTYSNVTQCTNICFILSSWVMVLNIPNEYTSYATLNKKNVC